MNPIAEEVVKGAIAGVAQSVLDVVSDKRASFKMPLILHNVFEGICNKKGLSKSEGFRQAINLFVDKNHHREHDKKYDDQERQQIE